MVQEDDPKTTSELFILDGFETDQSPHNQEEGGEQHRDLECDQSEVVNDGNNDPKHINPQILSKPTSEFLVPEVAETDDQSRNEEQHHREIECDQATSSKLGESEAFGDRDGFRTPTSLDQRIPKLTQCPPAPKKVVPLPPKKRKARSPAPSEQHCQSIRSRRSVMVLDLTDDDVDSTFAPRIQQDWSRKTIKRSAPTDN